MWQACGTPWLTFVCEEDIQLRFKLQNKLQRILKFKSLLFWKVQVYYLVLSQFKKTTKHMKGLNNSVFFEIIRNIGFKFCHSSNMNMSTEL